MRSDHDSGEVGRESRFQEQKRLARERGRARALELLLLKSEAEQTASNASNANASNESSPHHHVTPPATPSTHPAAAPCYLTQKERESERGGEGVGERVMGGERGGEASSPAAPATPTRATTGAWEWDTALTPAAVAAKPSRLAPLPLPAAAERHGRKLHTRQDAEGKPAMPATPISKLSKPSQALQAKLLSPTPAAAPSRSPGSESSYTSSHVLAPGARFTCILIQKHKH
jgi:hypothetical protein